MAGERTLPGIGLTGYANADSNGWNTWMDANLRTLSALVQLRVLNIVGALPGSPTNGDIYIVTAGPNANSVAVYDAGAWAYIPPELGIFAYNRSTGREFVFNGVAWVDASPIPAFGPGTAGKIPQVNADRTGFNLVDMPSGSGGGFSPIVEFSDDIVLTATDAGVYRRGTSPAARTVTVPVDVFAVGDEIHIRAAGAGQVSIVAGAGVTISTAETLKLRKRGSTATLKCVAPNTFDLMGDLEALP